MEPSDTTAPSVTVVVATRDREQLLRQTIAAVLAQEYPGHIEVVVVYDQMPQQNSHASTAETRAVRVTSNTRTPGLAGARNTGITMATGDLVAFCDDDDTWRPDKLRRQAEDLVSTACIASVTGITVHYDGLTRERIPDTDVLTVELLTHSRMTGAHPSSYLMKRDVFESVGLVDEELPGGYGEDYDWLLRLARVGPIGVVRAPLVDVLWHRGSYFSNRWSSILDGLDYLVEKHPAVARDPHGHARILGQKSFALAALGETGAALRTARRAFQLNPREQRIWVTGLVCSHLVSADWVMHQANKRGRGI